jgi:aromatic ring-cleaving dioxygenase
MISAWAGSPAALRAVQRRASGAAAVLQLPIISNATQFQTLMPWLMLDRERRDILVHPLTDDMVTTASSLAR